MYERITKSVKGSSGHNTILLVRSGSRSYGLEHEGSDWDAQGVYVGELSRYFGYRDKSTQFSEKNTELNYEYTVHEVQRFFSLASECNPNILEMLYVDEADILISNRMGWLLRDSRDLFLCGRARYSFAGYAMGQLKRIRTHRAWLLQPPTSKPQRSDFGLPNDTTLNHDTIVNIEAAMADNATLIPAAVMEVWQTERRYQNAKRGYEQYESWKKNRNPRRAELERKFGYDTHHAKHLVRLIISAKQLLSIGEFRVRLNDEDRKLVMSVYDGAMGFDQFLDMAQGMHDEVMSMDSVLPDRANHEELDSLCAQIIRDTVG